MIWLIYLQEIPHPLTLLYKLNITIQEDPHSKDLRIERNAIYAMCYIIYMLYNILIYIIYSIMQSLLLESKKTIFLIYFYYARNERQYIHNKHLYKLNLVLQKSRQILIVMSQSHRGKNQEMEILSKNRENQKELQLAFIGCLLYDRLCQNTYWFNLYNSQNNLKWQFLLSPFQQEN